MSNASTVEERWSEANVTGVISLWKFDADQEASMRELQDLIADIQHWKNDPYEVARYLVEFYFQVPKAAKMFRKMVEWRVEENMDRFLADYGVPDSIFHYVPQFLLRDLDYDGDPIYVMRIGALDAWGLYQKTGAKALLDYLKFTQEITTIRHMNGTSIPGHWQWQTAYYEPLANQRVRQFTLIVDLEGLSRRQLKPALFGVLKEVTRIGQDYYAGFGKRIIVFRAPRIFSVAWNIAKHFVDPHIQALISFTTPSDCLDVCSQYFDINSLPPLMGPSQGIGVAMPGYFECIRMEGGTPSLDMEMKCGISQAKRKETGDTCTSSEAESLVNIEATGVSLFKGYLNPAHQVVLI